MVKAISFGKKNNPNNRHQRARYFMQNSVCDAVMIPYTKEFESHLFGIIRVLTLTVEYLRADFHESQREEILSPVRIYSA